MISSFISRFNQLFPTHENKLPWQLTEQLEDILQQLQTSPEEYEIEEGSLIHKTAVIEQNVVLKGPVFVGRNTFISANAYLRGPVYLDEDVKIGAGCEIKQSIIFSNTAIAHFNYIGNSIIGSNVNFEAGSVAANHYNEREDKKISVLYHGDIVRTGVQKFGSLVGDGARIGANAVLSPGTILQRGAIVGRLELISQI